MNGLLSSGKVRKDGRGSVRMSRDDIRGLPAPVSTGPHHKPVSHIDLIESIEHAINTLDYGIKQEDYAIGRESIFGTMRLTGTLSEGDVGPAIGFRSSNDKKLAIRIVAGASVFVCDNLMISGEWQVLRKKHTTGLDLATEVMNNIGVIMSSMSQIEDEIGRLKNRALTDYEAKAFICDICVSGDMPLKLQRPVYEEYFNPRHQEFAPRTAWSLNNAITEMAKTLEARPRMSLLTDLSKRIRGF